MNAYAPILGLHHVQISVPPPMEKAAIRFYSEALGLSVIDKPVGMRDNGDTWFDLGNGQHLHLTAEPDVNRRATKTHLAYLVNDLPAWRQRMVEHEVTPVDAAVAVPGHDRFEARDPFGNRIEFIQRID